jgi:CBS domain-containing protein
MFDFDVRDLQAEGGSTDARRAGGGLMLGRPGPSAPFHPLGPTEFTTTPVGALALGAAMDAAIDAIPRRPPLFFPPTCSASDALSAIADHEHALALVTSHGHLFGTVTDRRLVRHFEPGLGGRDGADDLGARVELLRRTPVWKLMQVEPETLRDTDSIGYALHKMGVLEARAMPVVGPGGAPVGVLECRDLLAFLAVLGGLSGATPGGAKVGFGGTTMTRQLHIIT